MVILNVNLLIMNLILNNKIIYYYIICTSLSDVCLHCQIPGDDVPTLHWYFEVTTVVTAEYRSRSGRRWYYTKVPASATIRSVPCRRVTALELRHRLPTSQLLGTERVTIRHTIVWATSLVLGW